MLLASRLVSLHCNDTASLRYDCVLLTSQALFACRDMMEVRKLRRLTQRHLPQWTHILYAWTCLDCLLLTLLHTLTYSDIRYLPALCTSKAAKTPSTSSFREARGPCCRPNRLTNHSWVQHLLDIPIVELAASESLVDCLLILAFFTASSAEASRTIEIRRASVSVHIASGMVSWISFKSSLTSAISASDRLVSRASFRPKRPCVLLLLPLVPFLGSQEWAFGLRRPCCSSQPTRVYNGELQ